MAKTSPVYRTDTLACSLNSGKLKKVRGLVEQMRAVTSLMTVAGGDRNIVRARLAMLARRLQRRTAIERKR